MIFLHRVFLSLNQIIDLILQFRFPFSFAILLQLSGISFSHQGLPWKPIVSSQTRLDVPE